MTFPILGLSAGPVRVGGYSFGHPRVEPLSSPVSLTQGWSPFRHQASPVGPAPPTTPSSKTFTLRKLSS